jgi:restriction endonuclease S subunit
MSELIKDGPHHTPMFVQEGIPFLQKGDVKEGEINLIRPKKISKEFHDLNPLTHAKPNDVLIRKIGVGPREVAVVPLDSPPLHIFVTLAVIRLKKEYDPNYVEIFLNSSLGRSQTERRNKGIGSPCLHLEDLKTVLVPLPPNTIQGKITKKIHSARSKRRQVLARSQRLRTNVSAKLDEVLGLKGVISKPSTIYVTRDIADRLDAPYYNPVHEEVIEQLNHGKFKTVGLSAIAGFQKKRVDPANDSPDALINYVQIQDIDETDNTIVSSTKVLGKDASSRARIPVSTDDILVPILGGSSISVAKVAKEFSGAIVSNGFEVLRVHDEKMRLYLVTYLVSPYAQLQIERELTGTIMPSISKEKLGKIRVPRPDDKTLRRISELIGHTEKEIARLKQLANSVVVDAKKEIESLFLG